MAPSVPPATAVLLASMLLMSTVAYLSPTSHTTLLLLPGHTLLGDHSVWNVATAFLIDTHWVKLCATLGMVLLLSPRSEPQPVKGMTRRLALTVIVAVIGSGLMASFAGLMMYLATASEPYLYAPIWGTGPVAVSVAVAAHQLGGDAPLAAGVAPFLTYSSCPLVAILISALGTYAVPVSRDFIPTLLAWLLSWTYLRFLHDYGTPGAVGDVRDEFEFLVMMPTPLRTPLRPLIKLLSAMMMPLGIFARAKGLGVTSLPASMMEAGSGTAGAAGADARAGRGAADPVAERRRERALAALDKKLAELRTSMRGPTSSSSGNLAATATAPSVPAESTLEAPAGNGGPAAVSS